MISNLLERFCVLKCKKQFSKKYEIGNLFRLISYKILLRTFDAWISVFDVMYILSATIHPICDFTSSYTKRNEGYTLFGQHVVLACLYICFIHLQNICFFVIRQHKKKIKNYFIQQFFHSNRRRYILPLPYIIVSSIWQAATTNRK